MKPINYLPELLKAKQDADISRMMSIAAESNYWFHFVIRAMVELGETEPVYPFAEKHRLRYRDSWYSTEYVQNLIRQFGPEA